MFGGAVGGWKVRVERRGRAESVAGTVLWGEGPCSDLERAALFSFWDRTPWRPPQDVGVRGKVTGLKGSGLCVL